MKSPETGASRSPAEDKPLSVGQLSFRIARLLESEIGRVWVEGEISNLRIPRSGHAYFVLKDADAAINCVCFRARLQALRIELKDGDRVEVRGNVAAYTARSEYQIVVDSVRPAGLGELMRRFIELRDRLKAEGLFDAERKRPLPTMPRTVGIVTSATGAALQDMLNVMGRRASGMTILVSPCAVQGAAAAGEIVRAIRRLVREGSAEVIIVGRGGGSIEDLWAFNEEEVVRAVAECPIPVISGVGHETDTTLTDYAADLRAPTPSAAAELITAGYARFIERIEQTTRQLNREIGLILHHKRRDLDALRTSWGFRRPRELLQLSAQRLDDQTDALKRAVERLVTSRRDRLRDASYRLSLSSPVVRLHRARGQLAELRSILREHRPELRWLPRLEADRTRLLHDRQRMDRAVGVSLERAATSLRGLRERLDAVGPESVLRRGYSFITTANGKTVITGPDQARPGQTLRVQSAGGEWKATPLPPGDELFDSV